MVALFRHQTMTEVSFLIPPPPPFPCILHGCNQRSIEEIKLRSPRSSSFWFPRNLSNHLDRQDRIRNTVLVKKREMTGRSQTMAQWLGRGEIKTTENKIHWPRCRKVKNNSGPEGTTPSHPRPFRAPEG